MKAERATGEVVHYLILGCEKRGVFYMNLQWCLMDFVQAA